MTSQKKILALPLVLACACAPRAYTRGQYADPQAIEMLSDQFNENDLQLIAKKMVDSFVASKAFADLPGKPVIVIGRMRNSTSEHIDMRSLADKIQVQLARTNKFVILDKEARDEIAEEYDYQGAGMVADGTAKQRGGQASADFLFTGDISSIVQEVGVDKSVYYKMTAKLHDLKTAVVVWTEEKELRKKFEKQGVGW